MAAGAVATEGFDLPLPWLCHGMRCFYERFVILYRIDAPSSAAKLSLVNAVPFFPPQFIQSGIGFEL